MTTDKKEIFVSLHNHSDYSIFDAISKYNNMITKALEFGQDALGVSEHGTTSGLLDFYKQATKAGIKPILGYEGYISTNINIKDRGDIYHICLYAKDYEGYKNLNRINSFAHQNIYHKPRLSIPILRKYSKGLICTSACMGGLLKRDDAEKWARVLQEIFNDDFYIELQFNNLQGQYEYNQRVLKVAMDFNINITIGVDSHYINPRDAHIHRAWKFIKDDNPYYSHDDFYMHSQDQVIERILAHGFNHQTAMIWVSNTREIANKCNCIIPIEKENYPIFPDCEDQEKRMRELALAGMQKKLITPYSNEEIERMEKELIDLTNANYNNYFLIIEDALRWCDDVSKIGRSSGGRGSVVGSFVAYLLNITGINPLKHGLLFERFLNPSRVTPCDIDCDFESARRGEVIEYLKQKYTLAYQVRTFNLVGAKAGIQRAGQSMGLDNLELDRISSLIPKNGTLDNLPKKYNGKILTQKQYDKLLFLAYSFQGIIQSYGIHASAVMLFPKAVENWCSIECQDGTLVVNYDFHWLEEHCGLLKLDILALKTLDVIINTIKQVPDFPHDINNLPDADELTFKMLCKGNTRGCFQIEGDGMTQLVINLQPQEYKDLIPLVALYRPGCLKAGMVEQFVKRRTGKEEVSYLLPCLESVMQNTYGVMLYQEQVMQMVQVMANYSLGQADLFRRAIGRKDEKLMQEIIPPFIKACEENNYTHEQAQQVANYINGCSDYLFNMGHSAGYGYIAYQTAFLKTHYPSQFMCSLLNTYIDDKDSQTQYMKDAVNMGIKILQPSITKSKTQWSVTPDNHLRVGLSAIRNIGNFNIPTDIEEFHEFMAKYHIINKRVLEYLIKAGCFEGDRALQLAQLEWYKDDKKGYKRMLECREKIEYAESQRNNKKIAEWQNELLAISSIDEVKPFQSQIIEWERDALGFTFHEILDQYDLSYCDKAQDVVSGEIINIKPWLTKKGEPMAFIKLRTKINNLDLVIFDEHYKNLKNNCVYLFRTQGNVVKDIAIAKAKQ